MTEEAVANDLEMEFLREYVEKQRAGEAWDAPSTGPASMDPAITAEEAAMRRRLYLQQLGRDPDAPLPPTPDCQVHGGQSQRCIAQKLVDTTYICIEHGDIHVCSATCELALVEQIEEDCIICPFTGLSFAVAGGSAGASSLFSLDGHSKAKRARATTTVSTEQESDGQRVRRQKIFHDGLDALFRFHGVPGDLMASSVRRRAIATQLEEQWEAMLASSTLDTAPMRTSANTAAALAVLLRGMPAPPQTAEPLVFKHYVTMLAHHNPSVIKALDRVASLCEHNITRTSRYMYMNSQSTATPPSS